MSFFWSALLLAGLSNVLTPADAYLIPVMRVNRFSDGFGKTMSKDRTTLYYKNDDDKDWYDSAYPIPVGQPSISTHKDALIEFESPSIKVSSSKIVVSGNYLYDNCYYPIPVDGSGTNKDPIIKTRTSIASPSRKPIITQITSFQELVDFLTDDDRLSVVKFYAPWCKACRKLTMNLNKVVLDYGDVIINRVKVPGVVRFAQVEYSPKLEKFITQVLQIKGVPTVQIYHGTQKLWDGAGVTSTKEIVEQIKMWQLLSPAERLSHISNVDDGVLQASIDNSFYDDYPDFLDEEW